ncbi:hypothetical protein JQ629_23600 [Bradyrhizobium sp. AUGA SZCCT0222]|uniref:beta family protein n=1 Tax=Bradyrhizobium sp. AUGA SZCCT0222 TaxID=2807668 RepID=UPI001BA54F15|nr:hypothetical protein [Bradyrhizobium sp. AUGA SZCCT0222]MBR1270464.1 hypothetical protein [Bradyrhizobium sp. AUGA SZCCT0222]
MPFTYRPMLKTKAGEATALLNLAPGEKNRIAPVFHVAETPPATFAARMAAAWSGRTCFLDGSFNFNGSGTSTDFDNTFLALGASGIPVLPVIEIGAAHPYNLASFAHLNRFGPGLMLKCTPGNLPSASGFAQQMNVPQNQIDLLIDGGHISEYEPVSFAGYVSHILQTNLPGSQWRSVTLGSSSAPKDFGQLALGTTVVPRIDWLMWSNIVQPPAKPVDFADFGISHRDLTEPPGIAMAAATVSVRYTIANNWVMIKGRRTTGATGVPMGHQYRAHAQTLRARPDFGGLPICWADQRITSIATTTGSAGGRAQWVEINANRHFTFIANTLP